MEMELGESEISETESKRKKYRDLKRKKQKERRRQTDRKIETRRQTGRERKRGRAGDWPRVKQPKHKEEIKKTLA